ncbi:hypothetical protein [Streptomyces sp. NBC_01445]|uniref:hypothetical protein n=1 Tax=Streptomyces sp. NBC_01445 TaxID=2903869 RepID=UPI002DDAF4A3|nr:hypothetical protein [Streptomyces sp. NBC_01445]WSE04516.1 hypothetical protein OG574_14810 [Streptomyces sp. NBC_01445]
MTEADWLRGDRLVLPLTATEDEVITFAEAAGFNEGHERRTSTVYERVWIISGPLYFHYVDNTETGVSYVQVTGDSARSVERFTGIARKFFSPREVPDLMTDVRSAETSDAKAFAVVRLATGLMSDPPPEAMRLLEEAFGSSDRDIRRAAMLSALYVDWPFVAPFVRRMHEHDDEEPLRQQAGYFVERNDEAS